MSHYFCIGAGQLTPKKGATTLYRRSRYLNFGLLSLASLLKKNGLDVLHLQGDFTEPEEFFRDCLKLGLAECKQPVLLSIPTFFALPWANHFLEILKRELPHLKVWVGGRWTIDGDPDRLRRHLPGVDRIIDGLGEQKLLDLLGIAHETRSSDFPELDFSVLWKRLEYQPSIEISRGCGMGCSFCQESSIKLTRLKPITEVIRELGTNLIRDDGYRPMTPYFQASMFRPSGSWLRELINHKASLPKGLEWRAQSRVDMLSPYNIPLLAEAGLKVLDLGLESASPMQLKAMGKTTRPNVYLRKASELLQVAASKGIWVKLNILLFAGETESSIEETREWLWQHRELIKGISIGPVYAFGWPRNSSGFVAELQSLGAKPRVDKSFTGVEKFDLSPEISFETAEQVAASFVEEFMAPKDYFDLKAFTYFPRTYTYADFISDSSGMVSVANTG